MTDTTTPLTDRRTGQIDPILFGRMIELIGDGIRQRDQFLDSAPLPGSFTTRIRSEMDGRILGIAQACSVVSGIDAKILIERVRAGMDRHR